MKDLRTRILSLCSALAIAALCAPAGAQSVAADKDQGKSCWLQTADGNKWMRFAFPGSSRGTEAACKQLDSCYAGGGKGSGGGCYKWAADKDMEGVEAPLSAPSAPFKKEAAPALPKAPPAPASLPAARTAPVAGMSCWLQTKDGKNWMKIALPNGKAATEAVCRQLDTCYAGGQGGSGGGCYKYATDKEMAPVAVPFR